MVKQRRDSIKQYSDASREDLAQIEHDEIKVIERYLPARLGEAEIIAAIQTAIADTGASSSADMGKLMGALKTKLAGQADMGQVSALVKNTCLSNTLALQATRKHASGQRTNLNNNSS